MLQQGISDPSWKYLQFLFQQNTLLMTSLLFFVAPYAPPHTHGSIVEAYIEFGCSLAVLFRNSNVDVQFSGGRVIF